MNNSEALMYGLLRQRGIFPIPQQAIGIYNCDLGCFPVAVEILGGDWMSAGTKRYANYVRRTSYLLNADWHVLMVKTSARYPITPDQADYLVTYIEAARSNPSSTREYRVIRGAGQLVAAGCANDNEVSFVPTFTCTRDLITGRYKTISW
jgi:hypothetical protein